MADDLGAAILRVEVDTDAANAALQAFRKTVESFKPEFRGVQQSLRNVTTQVERARTQVQSLNQVLNQAPGSSYSKISAQIIRLTRESRDLSIASQEYLGVLQRISELEFVRGARAGRQRVTADFEAARGAVLRRGFGSEERLPQLPQTIAADLQRLRELNFILNNTDTSAAEFGQTLNEIAVTERRVSDALNNTSEAFRRQEQAAAGAERRLAKLQQIQQYYSDLNPRAGGFRDPSSGAMIARGAGAAADERAYRAALGASKELLQTDLQRIQAIRQVTQALREAAAANKASQESGFAAFSQSLSDPTRKSKRRNERQVEARTERATARQDIFEADLARVREARIREERADEQRRRSALAQQRQQDQRRDARNRRASDVLSNALIGGAFPALFGQGLGASFGGFAGGGAGGLAGGGFGFGLSLVGTALGAQFDEAINKSRTLGQALNDPIGQFDALKQAALLSSKGLERQVDGLIKTGRSAEAAALLQADLNASFGDLSNFKSLNTAFDDLGRTFAGLSLGVANFIAGPLTDFLERLNAALTVPQSRQLENQRLAEGAVQNAIGPLGGSGFFGGVELEFRGKKYKGSAAGIRQAIIADLNKQDLAELRGERRQQTAAATEPVRLAAAQGRADILTKELQVITAQTQGYQKLALERQKELSISKELLDIDNLRAQNATQPEINARRIEGEKERFELQTKINKLERDSNIIAQTRRPILLNELGLIRAQAAGEELRTFELRRRAALQKGGQQVQLEPGRRQEIIDSTARELVQIDAERNKYLRERAAKLREITFSAQQEQQAAARSLQFARERATLDAGPARQALETTQGVQQTIADARAQAARAQEALRAAEQQGGDAGRLRAFEIVTKDLPAAASAIELALINGSTALRDAARDLTDRFRAAVLDFTRIRSDPQGLNRFLNPEQRDLREQQNFRLLLPQFQNAQQRFTQLTGQPAPEFQGPLTDLNQTLRDFIGAVDQEFNAGINLTETTAALNKVNTELVAVNTQLNQAITNLAGKDWTVNVAVASDGKFTTTGDVLNKAAGAL